jgi:2-dehydropantoate 2-reductase
VRYIIYGAGAIGSILGGHLHQIGRDVVLVGPSAHVRAIRRRGLALQLPNETLRLKVPAVTRARDLRPFRSDDIILLCAKSHQTVRCLSELQQAGAPRSLPVFCAQNSFVNEPQTTLFFDRVYGMTVVIDGIFVRPGEAVHATGRRGGHLDIGRYPSGVGALARRVARDFKLAGFSVETTSDVMARKRAKFLVNMANAAIAITDQPDGVGPIVARLRAEAKRVLRESGLSVEPLAAFRRRAAKACGDLVVPAGAAQAGLIPDSTWQSLYRRRGAVETPYFNGVIVELGERLGIPTPWNRGVVDVISRMAARRERPGRYSPRQLMQLIQRGLKLRSEKSKVENRNSKIQASGGV